jgi:protein-S-isoprenylcysteine O-methyltransferase Ste14
MAIFIPVGIFHRLKSRTGEKLDRRQEGLFILITLRLLGVASMIGLLLYLVYPPSMRWAAFALPVGWRWFGVALALAGGALAVWTLRNLGKNLTDTVVTRTEHTLITFGPYHWVRHPFYLAAALLVLGNSLATANGFILVAGGLTVLLLAIRTRKEEQNLMARFGDQYRSYMQHTGRFFPRFHKPVAYDPDRK